MFEGKQLMTNAVGLTKRIASAVLALVLAVAFVPIFAPAAQADEIARGTSGGCTWTIDGDGTLTVRPTSGKSGTLADLEGTTPWHEHVDSIVSARIMPGVLGGESLDGLFAGCKKMRSVDLSGLSTSGVQGMNRMFAECSTLTSIDLTGLDTSSATAMIDMFDGCSALTAIDVSRFNTMRVTSMKGMFRGCSSLASINVNNFDTFNVTDMSDMFVNCSKLSSFDVSNFDTSRVRNMQRMFSGTAVENLDLSYFDTSDLTDMWGMFFGCTSLKSLDLSSFDTSDVTSMGYLFEDCGALDRVRLGANFAFIDESCELPQATWLSSVAGRSYTSEQIATERNNVADTYTKSKADYPGPSIVSGAESVWAKGSKVGALFRSSAAVEDFVCVKVDNSVVNPENYDLSGNQTNVTLKPEYLEGLSIGEHSIDILSATGTASTKFTISNDPSLLEPVNMYRLYNPNSGEHFYTASEYERDHLVSVGWTYERIGWIAPKGGSPVYRLYNPNAGEHHYTMDAGERDVLVSLGWNDEGIGWRTAGTIPLYRQYNPNAYANNHNYTTSEVERDHLLGLGWQDEGIGWYGIGE